MVSEDALAEEVSGSEFVGVENEERGRVEETEAVAGQEEGEEKRPTEDDEWVNARVIRRPNMPSRREVEEHNASHLPFADWCPFCVSGRGVSSPHRASEDKDPVGTVGTIIGLEYCFAGTEEKDDETPGILIFHCYTHSRLWAIPVEKHGAGGLRGKVLQS